MAVKALVIDDLCVVAVAGIRTHQCEYGIIWAWLEDRWSTQINVEPAKLYSANRAIMPEELGI